MPAAGRRLSTDPRLLGTKADRAQDGTDDSVRVERGQPAFTEHAQHVNHNPDDNLEFQLRGPALLPISVGGPRGYGGGCFAALRIGGCHSCGDRGPSGVIEGLVDECFAAEGDAERRIGNGGPTRLQQFIERLDQFLRDRRGQCFQAIEMGVERSFRDASLLNHVIDRDGFHGPLGKQRIGSFNKLRTSPQALFASNFSPADQVNVCHCVDPQILITNKSY